MAVHKFQLLVFGGVLGGSHQLLSALQACLINKSPNWGNLPLPNGLCKWLKFNGG